MAFLDKVTPSQYRLTQLIIRRDAQGDVTATFEFALYGDGGENITHAQWDVTLTSGEVDTLSNFVTSHLAEFETETGLTKRSD